MTPDEVHEVAFGMTGINDYTGTPQNPQDASRIPGGSSSGSAAAVGLKLADAALGTPMRRQGCDVFFSEPDPAGANREQAGDALDDGGASCSVASH